MRVKEGLAIGTTSGCISFMAMNFELLKNVKLHTDLVTDILEIDDKLVSCSLDGTVVVSCNDIPINTTRIDTPLWKIKQFNNSIYACGNPSIKLNLSDHTHKLL